MLRYRLQHILVRRRVIRVTRPPPLARLRPDTLLADKAEGTRVGILLAGNARRSANWIVRRDIAISGTHTRYNGTKTGIAIFAKP